MEKTLDDYMRESAIRHFEDLGIGGRLYCAHCPRLAQTIRKVSYDGSPNHYECQCWYCGRHWYVNDTTDSPR